MAEFEDFDAENVQHEGGIGEDSVIRFGLRGFGARGDNAEAVVANNMLTVTANHGDNNRMRELPALNIDPHVAVQGRQDCIDVTVIKVTEFDLNAWLAEN
ncbi:hypothetical protein DPMN_143693 [Dreissena polymorpha]|uniref:Uncharacterized protein n=1 Tax=Dreissena polymorpha TaxID=45954 RepID=A0A9D4GGP3_DREPO|nr:hypothetical protein DPMN_143693 [Dreissena polymorpha]